jgi:hypothetical protein
MAVDRTKLLPVSAKNITNLYEKIIVGRTFLAKAGSGKCLGIHAMNGVVSECF